jgi:hypothetical protein
MRVRHGWVYRRLGGFYFEISENEIQLSAAGRPGYALVSAIMHAEGDIWMHLQ